MSARGSQSPEEHRSDTKLGTLNSPCRFLDCEYRLLGESFSREANFGEVGDRVWVTPLAGGLVGEWGVWADTGGNALHIWCASSDNSDRMD